MVNGLRKKLLRDVWRLRYQCLTIALLVGCGIASFVAAVAASASMVASRDAFYADARLGDIFVQVKRAPRSILSRLSDLPGVATVDGRVVQDFRLEIPDSTDPVVARFVSLGWPREERLNQIKIRVGRLVEPGSTDEVVLGEALAQAWDLVPGSTITAVINEHKSKLRVVGIGVSPEFAWATGRAGLPDPRHFGIVWMDEQALAKATNLVGAFNDVSIQLGARADPKEIMRAVDQILEPFGGLGAIERADQPSAKLVDQKIAQLAKLARTLPVLFLGIASFLLSVLLSRIVSTQREQIATLKALGFRTRELSQHYLEFSGIICCLGVVFGIALGILAAHGLLIMYARYFKFPVFIFRFHVWAIVGATAVAFAAGMGATLRAVQRAVAIPPAEAMRPEPPQSYHASRADQLGRSIPPVMRLVLRDVLRRPVRLLLSAGSIALATAIVVAGSVLGDSMNNVLRLQFEVSHREALTIAFNQALDWRAIRDVAHIPGVIRAEGERLVPVRVRAGLRSRTTAILGIRPDTTLHQLLDVNARPLQLPSAGLSLSRVLAQSLDVHAGDVVDLEVLESDRRILHLPVASLIDDLLGFSGYMDASELAGLLNETPRANIALAAIDRQDIDAVTQRLDACPLVASVSRPDFDRDLVRAEVGDVFTVMSVMLALFAMAIAVGVVYNNARIALETRSRDLATMRILGFTRGELAAVLLGEQAIQVVLGIPLGLYLGRAMGGVWLSTIDRELLRVPISLAPSSYFAAVCVVLFAALVSALIVRRQSDRLDLVAVLKARD
jgi:putative ABC transport system permease protein